MDQVFTMIAERKSQRSLWLYTGITGEFAGKKLLLSHEEVIYSTFADTLSDQDRESLTKKASGRIWEQKRGKIFCEKIGGRSALAVCGSGHVGLAVVRLGKMLDYEVAVFEDRPYFAEEARKAGADRVICDDFEHALKIFSGSPDTYYVVMTRGHRYDLQCLLTIFHKPFAYVGMMGSHYRARHLKETLAEEGVPQEKIRQLHAPIGLSIGAQTPEEIAVSVMAEITQEKHREEVNENFTEEILEGLRKEGDKILATIVARRGSAPRMPGTRMVIFRDGSTVGTIGGGVMEAKVAEKAGNIFRRHPAATAAHTLMQVDMRPEQAAEEGMVCGGIQDVYLEMIK